MALSVALFTLKDYVVDEWTTVVPTSSTVISSSAVVANTGSGEATVMIDIADSNGNQLAIILPEYPVPALTAETINIRSVNSPAGSQIRVKSNVPDVHFTFSGANEL